MTMHRASPYCAPFGEGGASKHLFEAPYANWAGAMLILRRTVLLVLCVAVPPLLAYALYAAGQTYLAISHKFLDPQTQIYAFYFEIVIFYFGSVLELRSRWSPAE